MAPQRAANAMNASSETAPREGPYVLTFTALAVVARLVWVLAVPTHPVGDFAMYWESAAHVVAHGALDPEFIYMPGYVFALAAVQWLGGGLVAAKLLGVAAGGLATAAVTGLALHLAGRRAAIAAGLLCALWPAGIAVAGVTGTDMPAAALLIGATWLLVRDAESRPLRGAIAFGVALGLAAWVRAVALPLAAMAAPLWLAYGAPWQATLKRTALSCAIALVVLAPWGIRNQLRYGELFLTDSHGGHTALVGANPNTEGVYSRSLNLMFARGTGYALFAEPHRAADHAAYLLARRWAAFEPSYALGLLGAKADRLLTHERPLLYWPIYRQGVLAPDSAQALWLAAHRTGIERLCDWFWYGLVAAGFMGLAVAISRRYWRMLALVPLPLALASIYVAFFSEVRYHLAIAVFLFPFAGLAWRWLAQGLRDALTRRLNDRGRRRLLREAALGAALIAGVFVGWPEVVASASRLRETHRWGVALCHIEGADRLCEWRSTIPAAGEGPSSVRGVWNGIGLRVTTALAAAATEVDLPPSRYRVSVVADTAAPGPLPEVRLDLKGIGAVVASATLPVPTGAPPPVLTGFVEHRGGPLQIEVHAERLSTLVAGAGPPTVWITDLKIEAEVH
jgi:4-amino-4-deoxy-L-arabinose transferase-like glycosyltransferase